MHLKLRNLLVFNAVMETGSISKAAERLGVSQPAVSIALTKLEEMLGFSLFNRSKGYFVPRPEAKLLHADAELAIMAFERFASHADLIGRGEEGLIRIGSIGSTAFNLLPQVISDFTEIRDQVEVELQVRSSTQITHFVSNNQIDFGIVEAPISGLSIDPVEVSIPCVCILRHDDPLAKETVIRPEHLAGRRLISVFEDHPLDRDIRQAFISAGVPWQSQIRCYFFAVMRNLVEKGAGVAIVDAINGQFIDNDNVIWRPFEPLFNYKLAVITQNAATLQSPANEFLEMLLKALRKYEKLPAD